MWTWLWFSFSSGPLNLLLVLQHWSLLQSLIQIYALCGCHCQLFAVSKQFLVVLGMVACHYAGNRALAISKSSDEVFCGYYNPLASVCNWQIRFIRKLMFAKTQVKQSILLTRFEQRKKKARHIFGIETPTGNFAP